MPDADNSEAMQRLIRELNDANEQIRRLQRDLERLVAAYTRELAASEARYRSLVSNMQDVILVLDANGTVIHADGNLIGVVGYTSEELLSIAPCRRLHTLVHPDDADRMQRIAAQTRAGTGTVRESFCLRDKAGECRWVEATFIPLCSDECSPDLVQLVLRDTSERVQAEQIIASLNSAANTVQLASRSPDEVVAAVIEQLEKLGLTSIVALVDDQEQQLDLSRISENNQAIVSLEHLLGVPRDRWHLPLARTQHPFVQALTRRETLCLTLNERFVARLLPEAHAPLARVMLGLFRPTQIIMAPMMADGQVFGLLIALAERLSPSIASAISTFANQTAIALLNARLMSSLRESERQYRGIFEAAKNGFLVLDDKTGCILEANAAACRMHGYEYREMIGRELSALVDPGYQSRLEQLAQSIEQEGHFAAQSLHLRRDGVAFPVEIETVRLSYRDTPHTLAVISDITERVEAQETMIRAERLRTLGQMAGGIAHDFNNILVGIRGYADIARLDLVENPDMVAADIDQIVAGADDAAEAVRRLQSLYRQTNDTSDFSSVQLDDVVTQALDLTRPRWKDQCQAQGITVQIETHLAAPPAIRGNPGELRRLLTNLIVNAVDAMPDGGHITISTGYHDGWSHIQVRDTGTGIPAEQLSHIFEPFFSTKESSGLGLTVSQNIVTRHGGTINVESEQGRGTVFIVRLPIPPGEDKVTPPIQVEVEQVQDQDELNVLVVDDEAAVRQLMTRFLEREGHCVTAVASGRDALQMLNRQPFDLLITDLGMPDVSGHEVTRYAHERSPHMPTVLITGWGETITPEQLEAMNILALLPKPFSHADLRNVLQRVTETRNRPV